MSGEGLRSPPLHVDGTLSTKNVKVINITYVNTYATLKMVYLTCTLPHNVHGSATSTSPFAIHWGTKKYHPIGTQISRGTTSRRVVERL